MNAYDILSADDKRKVDSLLADTRRNGGLAPVDLDRFWADQAKAAADPFARDIAQPAFGASCTGECVFDELGIAEDYWRLETDEPWRLAAYKAYNDKAEKIVGRRLLDERPSDPTRQWPRPKGLHDVFEAKNLWHDRAWWLQQSASTPEELAALLDRVDGRDIGDFILPPEWESQKARLTALGVPPPRYRSQRGPVTFACSILGPENLIFLILDQPALAGRLRDAILRAMLEIARVLDAEAGPTPESPPRGFHFNDDNCCLLNAEMYEFFGYPILKTLFDRYCPAPGDRRGQHSDSSMAHLLPVLARLNLTWVNFGPTLSVKEIRHHMPRAAILGQLAPFSYSRNEEANMVAEFLRDFAQARQQRGLIFGTAGSVNNGSRLTGMRLLMAAMQRYGQYDK
jgi:uroporphyrinogen decarboxylase